MMDLKNSFGSKKQGQVLVAYTNKTQHKKFYAAF